MSATPEIIEKIRKLLRLARSSNPHEAQLALQRALALAREHDVAVEGLNPDEQAREKKVTHQETPVAARLSYDHRYAWAVCRRFFNVTTVEVACIRMVDGWPRRGAKMAVVGTEADLCIARWVHGFIVHQFSWCWRHHRGRLRNRQAYVHGMYIGIVVTLEEQRPAPAQERAHALVLKERDTYIAAVIGKTTSSPMGRPDHAANAAAWAGYLQGRKTNINNPLQEGERTEALALR